MLTAAQLCCYSSDSHRPLDTIPGQVSWQGNPGHLNCLQQTSRTQFCLAECGNQYLYEVCQQTSAQNLQKLCSLVAAVPLDLITLSEETAFHDAAQLVMQDLKPISFHAFVTDG